MSDSGKWRVGLVLAVVLAGLWVSGIGAIRARAGGGGPLRPVEVGEPKTYLPLAVVNWPLRVDWDPRLTQRGTVLIPAEVQSGQGYWRLARGVWYGVDEPPFAGQHHIFVDALDDAGHRDAGVPVRMTGLDGTVFTTLTTEEKPGELYAANFPMYALAPAYRAVPYDGAPADAVSGMGLGSLEYPAWAYHTSYGFVWRWTIAP